MDVRRLVITNRDSSPLCQDCGYCCTMVVLSRSAEEWLESVTGSREIKWFKSDLEVMSPQEAEATGLLVTGLVREGLYFYECQMWDPAAGGCTDYGNRPEPCRRFPYYVMKDTKRMAPCYRSGCQLGDFLYSLLDLKAEDVELRMNGHG